MSCACVAWSLIILIVVESLSFLSSEAGVRQHLFLLLLCFWISISSMDARMKGAVSDERIFCPTRWGHARTCLLGRATYQAHVKIDDVTVFSVTCVGNSNKFSIPCHNKTVLGDVADRFYLYFCRIKYYFSMLASLIIITKKDDSKYSNRQAARRRLRVVECDDAVHMSNIR